jgi:hypothetical protein
MMRPWIIACSGILVAVLAAGGLASPWLHTTPPSALAASAAAHAAPLALAALATYALWTLLATTAVWESELYRLRARLAGLVEKPQPPPRQLAALCAETRFQLVAVWLGGEPAEPAPEAGGAAAMPEALRGEAVRLLHIWLARAHFYSALALLAALAAFGIVEDYRPVLPLPSAIPTMWALLALVGLVLLALLARLGIEVSVEPVVEPLRWLAAGRRASELTKRRAATPADAALTAILKELGQRIASAVDSRRDAALAAAAKLAAATEAGTAALRSSVDGLQAALDAAVERLPGQPPVDPPAGFAELQAAIERLTAALTQLGEPAEAGEGLTTRSPGRVVADEKLARELAQLLREIDAER